MPIIGVVLRVEYPGDTHRLTLKEEIRRAIINNGGTPIGIVPPQNIDYTTVTYKSQEDLTEKDKNMLIEELKLCDGILMPGGFRANKFDMFILDYAIVNDIPILGICLGMQIMSNYKRDVFKNEKNDSFIEHKGEGYMHEVTLDKSSKLYSIIKKDRFKVTSRHLYHILPNDNYVVSSLSDDNYIESIEMKDKKYHIGVQWHPESSNDEISNKIFKSFIEACSK